MQINSSKYSTVRISRPNRRLWDAEAIVVFRDGWKGWLGGVVWNCAFRVRAGLRRFLCMICV